MIVVPAIHDVSPKSVAETGYFGLITTHVVVDLLLCE
jgi:hypothetical protein